MSKLLRGMFIILLVIFLIPYVSTWSVDFSDSTDGLFVNRDYVLVNVTSSAANTTNITINLYNSTGTLIYSNFTENQDELLVNFTSLYEDTYYFNATATDNESNENSTNYTITQNVTIDLTYPVAYYNVPTDNGTVTLEYIIINISANDTYLKNITIYIYNSTSGDINQTFVTGQTNIYLNYSDNITDGETYYFNATACDIAGNCNSTIETWNVIINLNIAPVISMNLPLNNSNSNESLVMLNITAYDDDLNNMTIWIYGDDILIHTAENQTNGTEITYEWNITSDGQHNWTTTANDGTTNSTNEYYYFTIDTTYPDITIISPQNITYNNISILVTINSTGDNTWFFNGTGNKTYNGTPEYITFSEGENIIYAYTNDTVGNLNTTEVTFYINTTDITEPTITINSPLSQTYNTTDIDFNVTLDENGTCIYSLNAGADNSTMNTMDNINFDAANATLDNENYTITFYCNDTIGNWNSNSTSFQIDTTAPSIVFNSPTNNTTTNISNVTFNITVTDANFFNITLRLYNSTGSITNSTTENASNSIIIMTNLSDGLYNYNATAYDTLGHDNVTETRTITINTTTPIIEDPEEEDDGGSNGGSSSGDTYYLPIITSANASTDSVNVKNYWSVLPEGNRIIAIDKEGMPLNSISIMINTRIDNRSSLEINTNSTNPFNVSIDAEIYKYLIINTSINSSYIDNVSIKFMVDKKWIEDNNLSEENISLYEYNTFDSKWTPVKTSKITEDESNVYYSSTSAGLLSLAIGGIILQPVMEPLISNTSDTDNSSQVIERIGGDSIIVNAAERSGVLRSIGKGMSDSLNNTRTKLASIEISDDAKILIIAIISILMMLTIGLVTGVLIYKNISAAKEAKKIKRESYRRAEKILHYEEEPPSTDKIISTASIARKESEARPLSNSSIYIKNINQLLMQCEYALDNGKIEDAKKHYAEARNIYFHSNLDYEQKSRVYNKIIELSRKINK